MLLVSLAQLIHQLAVVVVYLMPMRALWVVAGNMYFDDHTNIVEWILLEKVTRAVSMNQAAQFPFTNSIHK
jgi:hypothetical protein